MMSVPPRPKARTVAPTRAIAPARPRVVEARVVHAQLAPSGGQIAQVRSRAASRVSALRGDLLELENLLAGKLTSGVVAVKTVPRISVYRSLLSETLAVNPVGPGGSAADYLQSFETLGLRERSFDRMVPVTAPNPIDDTGNAYDAQAVYDAWILNPSIDTKFDFNGPPSQNTPSITANSRMQVQVRAQKVYYLAENPGTVGTLQIWLLKYAGT